MTIERNDPRVLVVLVMIYLDPHISIRQIEVRSGISRETVRRITRLHRYHPYHITLTQELTERDFERRLRFCQWAQERLQNDPHFFRYVMFSDEATFHNTGQLNRHNSHYWSIENPHWTRAVDHQHQWSLVVWCDIVNGYLIGPYFFDGNVNRDRYLHFLTNELPNLLEDVNIQTRMRMWLQHDGAPAHRSLDVQDFLNQTYRNRWIGIGRGEDHVEWPPRSPDLTSPDFYLWGFLKNSVYADAPTTRENMMQRIINTCRGIPRHVLLSTVGSFERRIQLCIRHHGGIFEHLIR
ncbi:uncharacterized protein LOC116416667 [Nasonia vitripennis]|uniref:Transposase n=1 Tax=Nasonia vitripennis TaxID=7425 RepID=A0A7M7Q6U2_NASVI|nr:uncharacterized protein LOC116416667 [Nasonia vitripennis]